MKRIKFLLLAVCLSVGVSAQTVFSMTGGGTYTNTATAACSLEVKNKYKSVAVQAIVTKNSGTVAGYVVLKGSVDGTNYVDVAADSLSCTNQTTNTYIWVVTTPAYRYYKLSATGTGTMSASLAGKLYPVGEGGVATTATTFTSPYSAATDTTTNSGTSYVDATAVGAYDYLTIQPVITKISGTVGGTLTLKVSLDGTNYVTASTSLVKKWLSGAEASAVTTTPTDQATNSVLFRVTGNPYKYYRLSYAGTGTMSATIAGKLIGK